MSIEIMNLCWSLDLDNSVTKFILVSLADNANNSGTCYPSISYIAHRTSCSERTVHRALIKLEELGLITRQQRRTSQNRCQSNYYTINATKIRQKLGVTECQVGGDRVSGGRVTECQVGGDRVSEKPSKNHHIESKKESLFLANLISLGIERDLADEWLAIRKKSPDTERAWNGFMREVGKSGWTVERAVEWCCEKGWKGFEAKWIANDKQHGKEDFFQMAKRIDSEIKQNAGRLTHD